MIRVMDLFSGTQSVKKALTEKYNIEDWSFKDGIWYGWNGTIIVEYIGYDVYSPEDENRILDLVQDDIVNKLIDNLPEGWTPDLIWASPVCNKLSLATAMKGGGNVYFELDRETQTIAPRPIGSKVEGAKNYQTIVGTPKAYEDAMWELKLFENTKKIIKHFNVPFAIENPEHSLTRYLMKGFVRNRVAYCMYDFPQQKRTNIYSNIELQLLTCNHPKGSHKVGVYGKAGHKNKELIKKYSDRAAVPPKLIQEIFKQLEKGETNE